MQSEASPLCGQPAAEDPRQCREHGPGQRHRHQTAEYRGASHHRRGGDRRAEQVEDVIIEYAPTHMSNAIRWREGRVGRDHTETTPPEHSASSTTLATMEKCGFPQGCEALAFPRGNRPSPEDAGIRV